MNHFQNQVIWITGASSGIGEALAIEAVRQGARVILSARREGELQRVQKACGGTTDQTAILPLDLTESSLLASKATEAQKVWGHIDVLINNGGISQRGNIWETDLQVDRRIMEINFFGAVALTKAVLPDMLKRKKGHIAVVSSVVGKFGFLQRSAYSASKHAIDGFFESAWLELQGSGVSTTIVSPGRINTPISLSALRGDGKAHGEMDPGQQNGIPAEVCARKILKAIRKKKPEVVIARNERILIGFKRWIPPLFRIIARKVSPK